MKPFSHLALSKEMLTNLAALHYDVMTPIQEAVIPVILQGKDLLAQAKTGSGKTAAFGVGVLERLEPARLGTRCLVLCPVRELSEQVAGELRRIARFKDNVKVLCITGGVPMRRQEQSLSHPPHIIVGTPGRILKLMGRGSLTFADLETVVIDEADRMLDMGFEEDMTAILDLLPVKRQTLCFSATFPQEIRNLGKRLLNAPREISAETFHDPGAIEQHFYEAIPKDKIKVLLGILAHHAPKSVVVFCNTKDTCREVSERLREQGLRSLALNGDLDQFERTETLIRFANGSCHILVATDVAARGLDIKSLDAVVNYDFPFETETYVHRIGRTGRAGREGSAFSLVQPREAFRLEAVNEFLKRDFAMETPGPELNRDDADMDPQMVTLSIGGGRKDKIGPGDLLGALTARGGLDGSEVGKIDRLEKTTYCAVDRNALQRAVRVLSDSTIKGRRFKVRSHDV
jgi:ATP-independent RNA helicase DbpA